MPEIHKGKRRRKTHTTIWLADLYFLYALQVAETSSRGLQQRIKKVEISEPDPCLPSSFALVYFGRSHMWLFNYLSNYVRQLIVLIFLWKINVARLE